MIIPMGLLPRIFATILLVSAQPAHTSSTTETDAKAKLRIPDFIAPVSLVNAIMVKGAIAEGHIRSTFRVQEVFSGTVIEVGQTFVAGSNLTQADTTGRSIWPPPKSGERGFWVVGKAQGRTYSTNMMPEFNCRFPSRQGIDPRYAQAEALATTIGEIFHATPEKRLELLRAATHSDIPEVSGWAMQALAVVSPQDLIKEGAEAVAGKLPLAADIAVDEAMMKAQGPEWLNSDDRKTLLDHIARSKATEYESWLIERHLDLVSQHLGVAPLQHVASKGDRMLVDAITTAIGNTTFPLEARRVLVASLGRMARRNYLIAVPALHHVLQTTTEKRLREQAGSEISRSPQ